MKKKTVMALRELERRMRRAHLRAHVYVVDDATAISFATTTRADGDETCKNNGPGPVEKAWHLIEAAGGKRPEPDELCGANWRAGEIPTVTWNSPALLVTGVSAAHALVIAAEHPQQHGTERVRQLADLAGSPEAAAIGRWHEEATGTPLETAAAEMLEEALGADVDG